MRIKFLNMSFTYADLLVLDNIPFEVDKGEIVGLISVNEFDSSGTFY